MQNCSLVLYFVVIYFLGLSVQISLFCIHFGLFVSLMISLLVCSEHEILHPRGRLQSLSTSDHNLILDIESVTLSDPFP